MSFNTTHNSSLWPCLHLIHFIPSNFSNPECLLCRIGGIIILSVSILCLIVNIRYLTWYQRKRYRNKLVLSLVLSSLLVLIISVPRILIQLFTCHRDCNDIYCRIEGFTSYFGGCLCMLIYTTLSIDRYLLLCHYNRPILYSYLTLICWILSFIWTFPPVFDYWISYIPEGLGFHCSINWNDDSQTSFYYILFSFIIFYLIPLVILCYVNIRVHEIIQTTYLSRTYYYAHQEPTFLSLNRTKHHIQQRLDNRSNITIGYIHKAADRKRLRIEHRFIKSSIYLISAYLFAWTPYSIVGILQLLHINIIFQYTFFITLCAFIAKLSVILSPVVYLSIMNTHLFKKLLFH